MPFGDAYESNSICRYLPIMISRLMLSLKKAADTSRVRWSLGSVTHISNPKGYTPKRSNGIQFAPISDGETALPVGEGIPLGTVLPMP